VGVAIRTCFHGCCRTSLQDFDFLDGLWHEFIEIFLAGYLAVHYIHYCIGLLLGVLQFFETP